MKKELSKRIIISLIAIPLVVSILYYGGVSLLIASIILSTFCLYEYFNLFKHLKIKILKYSSYTFNLLILTLFYIILDTKGLELSLYYLFLMLLIMFVFSSMLTLFNKDKHSINQFSGTLSHFFYITLPFIALIALRLLYTAKMNFSNDFELIINESFCGLFIIGILVSIWSGDSAAYFIGRKIGKHKLFPSVSPHKSIEGGISNLIFAVIGFYIFKEIMFEHFPTSHTIIIGILIGIIGQIGDLFESKLKRHANVKDSSNLLPGHGGFLDRLDSTLFVIPAVLFYLLIVFAG